MSSLAWLMLQDNDLTGTIPAALSDLPNLSLLQLSNNNLSGTVPALPGVGLALTALLACGIGALMARRRRAETRLPA